MNAEQLRNSILQLAIQGKLVEQREEEGTAEELYQQIQLEKEQLFKEGKLKKSKPLPTINPEEVTFDIPPSWKLVRFGNTCSFNIGRTPSRDNLSFWGGDFPWISIADMGKSKYINSTKESITKIALKQKFNNNFSEPGTLIMSFKLTIGKVNILSSPAVHNEAIISIRPLFENNKNYIDYLYLILPMLATTGDYKKAIKGNTLNSKSINELVIPLPPLSEQQRIVDKIEELMPLIQDYGESYIKLEQLNKNFPQDIKQSILQYAIQGKLVEQREEEGTAEELHQKIQLEKNQLIKEGKLKRSKTLPHINQEEIPFEIPDNWKWTTLEDISVRITSGGTPSRSNPKFWNNGEIPWLKIKDIKKKYIEKADEYITEEGLKSSSAKIFPKGTILYTIFATIGDCGILNFDSTTNQAIAGITLVDDLLSKDYIYYVLIAAKQIMTSKSRGMAQLNINQEILKNLYIPLPPLTEQQRIVDKIEELLSITKALEGEIQ